VGAKTTASEVDATWLRQRASTATEYLRSRQFDSLGPAGQMLVSSPFEIPHVPAAHTALTTVSGTSSASSSRSFQPALMMPLSSDKAATKDGPSQH